MARRLAPPVLLVAFAAVAAPARGSTTVGQLAASTTACPAHYLLAQTSSNAPKYTMPTAGVVTALAGQGFGTAAKMDILVLRPPSSGTTYTVVGGTGTKTFTAGTGAATQSFPVRIPVKAGDVLALWDGPTALPCVFGSGAGDGFAYNSSVSTDPAAGSTVSLPFAAVNQRLAIQAKLEPDVDGDGYGDETQDSCPTDPAIHAGPCSTDLSIGQSLTPGIARVGSLLLDTITVHAAGPSPSGAYTITDVLPPDVAFVAGAGSGGPCTAAGRSVTCPGASIPSGAGATALLVMRPLAPGRFANVATVIGLNDPAAGNNASTATIRSLTGGGDRCVVPRLAGQPLAVARLMLGAAHCRAGRVTRPRPRGRRDGRLRYVVAGSNPRAGTARPAGAQVVLRLRPAG